MGGPYFKEQVPGQCGCYSNCELFPYIFSQLLISKCVGNVRIVNTFAILS